MELIAFKLLHELAIDVVAIDELDRAGDELERPFEFKLFIKQSFVCFVSDNNCTVSLRESSLNRGKRPSVTASTMHGSSFLINAFDNPLSGCFVFNL